eukprot:TRINITY_DN3270_c1_g3_i4.p1 TRINITY_DN3270_c1_g3~~TRINITY_DN3270_c1_g3_i4.p1  ORF type:complete len:729 (+),score=112.61 TRINITY_DN3270_c1_g3_i4:161-2347(+)
MPLPHGSSSRVGPPTGTNSTSNSVPPALPGGDALPLPQLSLRAVEDASGPAFRTLLASALMGAQEVIVFEHERTVDTLRSQVESLHAQVAYLSDGKGVAPEAITGKQVADGKLASEGKQVADGKFASEGCATGDFEEQTKEAIQARAEKTASNGIAKHHHHHHRHHHHHAQHHCPGSKHGNEGQIKLEGDPGRIERPVRVAAGVIEPARVEGIVANFRSERSGDAGSTVCSQETKQATSGKAARATFFSSRQGSLFDAVKAKYDGDASIEGLRERFPSIRELTASKLKRGQVRSKLKYNRISALKAWIASRKIVIDIVVSAAIVLNSAVLGLSCDLDWVQTWEFLEIVFVLVFSAEIILRFWLLGCVEFFRGVDRNWNIFEGILTAIGGMDLAINKITYQSKDGFGVTKMGLVLRILRIVRITRFIRLFKLKMFADLLLMINGTIGGIKTLCWSCALVAVPIYAFSIVIRETVGSVPPRNAGAKLFGDMWLTFCTLFRCIVVGDCSSDDGRPIFVLIMQDYGDMYMVLYMAIIMFMSFGLFNVIIAIYVDNTVEAAKSNALLSKRQRLRDKGFLHETATALIIFVWQMYTRKTQVTSEETENLPEFNMSSDDIIRNASSVEITKEFFDELIAATEFCRLLELLDISDENQMDLFDTLDVDNNGTIDLEELVNGLSKLRGDSRRSDVVSNSLVLRSLQSHFHAHETAVFRRLDDIGLLLAETIDRRRLR